MSVTIRPIGALKEYIGNQPHIQIQSGLTIHQALLNLHIPSEIVALVLVNEMAQNKTYVLLDGDEVKLLAVLGGG